MALELAKPVREILEKVAQVTKKEIEFVEKNNLQTYAAVKMARKNMKTHLIFHKSEHNELINHLIAHECGHIIRTFLAPPEKRVMPATDQRTKKLAFTEMEDDINRMSSFLSVDKIAQVMNLWYAGTVRQVTNFPPDIMIEKWIYNDYPELRPYQLESVKKQHSEAIQGLKDTVRQITPAKIFDASNIMNYAFFRIIGYHIGANFLSPYNQTPFVRRGKDLAAYTSANYLDSYEGDMKMIGYWTNYFDMSKWYRWASFEDIPYDYLETH